MLNCVADPSSLGVAMPSVSEYAAVGPAAPLLPQLPHVSQGFSSTRLRTVFAALVPLTGVGVGEGAGVGVAPAPGVGVGFGAAVAVVRVVEDMFPPQETQANVKARKNKLD